MNKQATELKDFYFTENGLMVFTEQYLLKRGFCCGNGCKHCPYNYQNVSEPTKSKILKEKGN